MRRMADESAVTTSSRRFVPQLAIGAVLGFSTSCCLGPGLVGWWYEPPIKDAFSCANSVRAAISAFVQMQFISAGVGAFVVLLGVFFVRRAFSKRDPGAAPTA
jgi:hypothetical protein